MKNKITFFIFLTFLLANAVFVNADESSSYTGESNEGLATGTSESTSYTLEFSIPYGQDTESGGASGSYYFGNFNGGLDIEEDPEDPPLSSSGGGSGGGRTTTETPNFNVSPATLKYFLKEGNEKSKDITIENKGTEEITINLVESSGFIGVEAKSVTIGPGQTKKLFILVSAMNEKEGIYTSKIILSSGNLQREVILLIEIEKAQSDLDLLVDVFEEDKIIVNKGNISSSLVLYDLSGGKEINVTLEYFIQDLNGNVIISETENKIIDSGNSFEKNIELMDKLGAGDYVFSVKATAGDKSVFSGSLFKVVNSEEEKEVLLNIGIEDYSLILKFGIFIFLFVFIIIIIETEKINLMIGLCEFNVKHKDFYHAKINYNKLAKMFKNHTFKKGQQEKIGNEIHNLHKHIVESENQYK
ncbi:MAG: hypothetical protein KAQ83_01930 [Nanoarchaeota archaeon]|nr:hypothetical protein [Nanoarchaeota archaeon]